MLFHNSVCPNNPRLQFLSPKHENTIQSFYMDNLLNLYSNSSMISILLSAFPTDPRNSIGWQHHHSSCLLFPGQWFHGSPAGGTFAGVLE